MFFFLAASNRICFTLFFVSQLFAAAASQADSAAGSPTAEQKANRVWKQALDAYQQPAIDPAIAEELEAFVAHRIEQGGQPTDF